MLYPSKIKSKILDIKQVNIAQDLLHILPSLPLSLEHSRKFTSTTHSSQLACEANQVPLDFSKNDRRICEEEEEEEEDDTRQG